VLGLPASPLAEEENEEDYLKPYNLFVKIQKEKEIKKVSMTTKERNDIVRIYCQF